MISIRNRWIILLAVLCAFLPIVIDMTVLHIAIPSLSLALNATGSEILWIIDIYPFIMAGMLIPMGSLGDKISHRLSMLIGLLIFGVASLFAAFSPTAFSLIIARAFLAIGAAMMMPSILALIRQIFSDPKERAIALGLWSTVGAAGAAAGPVVGGLLLEHFWWGSVFLINIPVVAFVFIFAFSALPKRDVNKDVEWKIGDALIFLAGLISLIYGIKAFAKTTSTFLEIIITIILGLVLISIFVKKQLQSKVPMLDISLFKYNGISIGLLIALVSSGVMLGFQLLLSQELQYVLSYSPLETGLFMLPLVISSGISGPMAGAMVGRFGLRSVATIGLLASALSLFGLAFVDFKTQIILCYSLLAVLGFAISAGMLTSSIAIMSTAPDERAGSAGSIEAMAYELGGGLGITFFGLFLTAIYKSQIDITGTHADSIAETIAFANTLPLDEMNRVITSAQLAFSSAHNIVLITCGSILAALTIVVFFKFKNLVFHSSEHH